jgi:hypothetical protein
MKADGHAFGTSNQGESPMQYDYWMVKVPLHVREPVGQLARAERRKDTDMLRILIEDALAQRINSEEMKKADAM